MTKIVRLNDALKIFGLSRTTFYRRINDGLIPTPISLGGYAKGWNQSELIRIAKLFGCGADEFLLKNEVQKIKSERENVLGEFL